MRKWIDLFEGMSLSHKPFEQVNTHDVVDAMLYLDDMRGTIENDWYLIFGDEDLPQDGDITSEWVVSDVQFDRLHNFYKPYVEAAKLKIAPVAALDKIPVTRRLDAAKVDHSNYGIHWSYGENANPLTRSRGRTVLTGMVKNQDVDWVSTIARGLSFWDEEKEISVLGNRVEITNA